MRKNVKYILSTLLVFAITLGFASQNNLGLNFASWGVKDDQKIEAKVVVETIKSSVISPIRTSIEKGNPHAFMTKCYSDIKFNLNGFVEQESPEAIIESGRTFYSSEVVHGTILLIDCGEEEPICRYRLHLEDNSVEVKESFVAEWKPLKELLTQIEKANK